MLKTAIVIVCFLIVCFITYTFIKNKNSNQINNAADIFALKINNKLIKVEVADTPIKRELGLMYRETLPTDQGMLFVFPKENDYGFWMQNTKIALDLIWINEKKEIVSIDAKVPTCFTLDPTQKNCPTYRSLYPSMYILEVNSGWTEQNNVSVGDKVYF